MCRSPPPGLAPPGYPCQEGGDSIEALAWTVPREVYWRTEGHEEHWRRERQQERPDPWEAVKDFERLTDEDADLLDALASDDPGSGLEVIVIPCWTADLYCDADARATTEHYLFREQEELVMFLRWLAVHLPAIPEREGQPLDKGDGKRRFDQPLGPVPLLLPDNAEGWEWALGAREAEAGRASIPSLLNWS